MLQASRMAAERLPEWPFRDYIHTLLREKQLRKATFSQIDLQEETVGGGFSAS
jgi:hypothetical protein